MRTRWHLPIDVVVQSYVRILCVCARVCVWVCVQIQLCRRWISLKYTYVSQWQAHHCIGDDGNNNNNKNTNWWTREEWKRKMKGSLYNLIFFFSHKINEQQRLLENLTNNVSHHRNATWSFLLIKNCCAYGFFSSLSSLLIKLNKVLCWNISTHFNSHDCFATKQIVIQIKWAVLTLNLSAWNLFSYLNYNTVKAL